MKKIERQCCGIGRRKKIRVKFILALMKITHHLMLESFEIHLSLIQKIKYLNVGLSCAGNLYKNIVHSGPEIIKKS